MFFSGFWVPMQSICYSGARKGERKRRKVRQFIVLTLRCGQASNETEMQEKQKETQKHIDGLDDKIRQMG